MLLLALVLAAAPPRAARAPFRASVLSLSSRGELDGWVAGGFLVRIRDAHKGTVKPGQRTLLPIVVERVPKGAALVADFRVVASDGRLILSRPACCRASGEAAPGLYVLEPVPELLLMPSDLAGLYTATAVVRDASGAESVARERLVHTP